MALKPVLSHRDTASVHPELQRMMTARSQPPGAEGQGLEDVSKDEKRPGYIKQTRVLMARSHKNVYRNYPLLIGFVGQGIILGVTYYQLPEVSSRPVQISIEGCQSLGEGANCQDPQGIQSLKNVTFQLIP
jgi:hypothetical protein